MPIKIEITAETGLDARQQLFDLVFGKGNDIGADDIGDVITKIMPSETPVLQNIENPVRRTRRSKKEDAPAGGENPTANVAASSTAPEAGGTSTGTSAADTSGQTPEPGGADASDAKTFTKAEVKSRLTELTMKIGAAPAITFMHSVTGIPKFNDVPDAMYAKLMAALDKKLAE